MLVDTDGNVKLADYGYQMLLQSLLEAVAPDPEFSRKDFWLAPENLNSIRTLECLGDTWAVGCLAFELMTGNPPFMLETQGDVQKLKELHRTQCTIILWISFAEDSRRIEQI